MISREVSVTHRILTIGKESLSYGVMASLSQFINFLLVPIYAHTFSPSDYGILDLIGVCSTFLSLVLELALSSSLGRFYYEVIEEVHRSVRFLPRIPQYPAMNEALNDMMASLVRGHGNVDSALREAGDRVEAILADS